MRLHMKLRAGNPWGFVERPAAMDIMGGIWDTVTALGSISPRFAARLVYAGALTAVERLAAAAMALEHSGEASGRDAGARAREADVLTTGFFRICVPTFGSFVPRVRRLVAGPLGVLLEAACLRSVRSLT